MERDLRAAAAAVIANGGGVAGGLVIKLASALPAAEVIAGRAALAVALLWLVGRIRRAPRKPGPLRSAIYWRAGAEAIASILMIISVLRLPLGVATAMLLTLPLLQTLMAVLFLAETVGWRRWTSMAVGFIGVALVVRPGSGGDALGYLASTGCVCAYALRDFILKRQPGERDDWLAMSMSGAMLTALLSSLAIAFGDWVLPTAMQATYVSIAALLYVISNIAIVMATREGAVAIVSTLRFTGLLWALLFDALFFAIYPDPPAMAGAALIVVSGSYLVLRTREVHLSQPKE